MRERKGGRQEMQETRKTEGGKEGGDKTDGGRKLRRREDGERDRERGERGVQNT